jgi:hypothetical protein
MPLRAAAPALSAAASLATRGHWHAADGEHLADAVADDDCGSVDLLARCVRHLQLKG